MDEVEKQLNKLRALYKMARLLKKFDRMKEIRAEAEELKKKETVSYEEAVKIFNG